MPSTNYMSSPNLHSNIINPIHLPSSPILFTVFDLQRNHKKPIQVEVKVTKIFSTQHPVTNSAPPPPAWVQPTPLPRCPAPRRPRARGAARRVPRQRPPGRRTTARRDTGNAPGPGRKDPARCRTWKKRGEDCYSIFFRCYILWGGVELHCNIF